MKTAYLKFCGGCNPKYDRGAVAVAIRKALEDRVEFFAHAADRPADIGVVIQGCERECVTREQLAPAEYFAILRSDADIQDVIRSIEQYLEQ